MSSLVKDEFLYWSPAEESSLLRILWDVVRDDFDRKQEAIQQKLQRRRDGGIFEAPYKSADARTCKKDFPKNAWEYVLDKFRTSYNRTSGAIKYNRTIGSIRQKFAALAVEFRKGMQRRTNIKLNRYLLAWIFASYAKENSTVFASNVNEKFSRIELWFPGTYEFFRNNENEIRAIPDLPLKEEDFPASLSGGNFSSTLRPDPPRQRQPPVMIPEASSSRLQNLPLRHPLPPRSVTAMRDTRPDPVLRSGFPSPYRPSGRRESSNSRIGTTVTNETQLSERGWASGTGSSSFNYRQPLQPPPISPVSAPYPFNSGIGLLPRPRSVMGIEPQLLGPRIARPSSAMGNYSGRVPGDNMYPAGTVYGSQQYGSPYYNAPRADDDFGRASTTPGYAEDEWEDGEIRHDDHDPRPEQPRFSPPRGYPTRQYPERTASYDEEFEQDLRLGVKDH